MTENGTCKKRKVICIPNTLQKSMEGKYFVGQTETLIIGKGLNAWGGLINPVGSFVNIHNTVITITNHSHTDFIAQLWFNSQPPGIGIISDKVSPADTSIFPLPTSKIQLQYVQSFSGTPTGGVNVFSRLVSSHTTLVREDDGKLIFPPQGSLVVLLESPGDELIEARLAFGWWEEGC